MNKHNDLVVRCQSCGEAVEAVRHCYAAPTCFACLPPPPPIERVWLGAPNVVDFVHVRAARQR